MKRLVKAIPSIYLDKRQKKNGKCTIKIRVTYNRVRRYYSTGIDLTPKEFEVVMSNKKKTPQQKDLYLKLNGFLSKAIDVIQDMQVFTFEEFESSYLSARNVRGVVKDAFEDYIERLESEGRYSTSGTYKGALKSLLDFKSNITFFDLTTEFLNKYERWMLERGMSRTTIGIYLRSLRRIYNLQNIDKRMYPFGRDKYQIPTGRNIKKALDLEDIKKILEYQTDKKDFEKARDLWIFMYLCNGMNVKDMCLLRWDSIDGGFIKYERAKTSGKKKDGKKIVVHLKDITKKIIDKYGDRSGGYVFPFIKDKMNEREIHTKVKEVVMFINKRMKEIAKEVGIDKPVTTYYARHSFATILKRSNVSVEVISELLGHSDIKVTENYLDSFAFEQIKVATDKLLM